MEKLYNLGISESTLKNMLEFNPDLNNLSDKDIDEKIELLSQVGCSDNQIINIISSNSMFLSRTKGEIIKLILFLKELGFSTLNILFDSNPYVLNLEVFEIKNYVKEEMEKGKNIDDIVDELDSNPHLFSDM